MTTVKKAVKKIVENVKEKLDQAYKKYPKAYVPVDKKTKKVIVDKPLKKEEYHEGKLIVEKNFYTHHTTGKEYVDITVVSGEVFRVLKNG